MAEVVPFVAAVDVAPVLVDLAVAALVVGEFVGRDVGSLSDELVDNKPFSIVL